ncbi:hypothetical protein [Phormidesmis priestleyi]
MQAKERLIQEIEQASDSLVEEVLDFLLFKQTRQQQKLPEASSLTQSARLNNEETPHNSKPIWELFEEFTKDIPEDVLAQLPTDGAIQHDHYLYSSPKQEL